MRKYIFTFGNQKHADKLAHASAISDLVVVHISDERSGSPGLAMNAEELMNVFEHHYDASMQIAAFVSFGRGSVVGSLESIAKSWELIRSKYPNISSAKFIGPSHNGARIFADKALTYNLLRSLDVPTPRTKLLEGGSTELIVKMLEKEKFPFPSVMKVVHLSGGQGMRLIKRLEDFGDAYNELSAGSGKLILSEFIEGPEASFALLRLGDTFLRIPPSYKDRTSLALRHSDCKVKMAGIFKQFEPIYAYLEAIMKREDIFGLLYFQAILQKTKSGEYTYRVIEGETRLTGSSPISFGALKGFDFYRTLASWIAFDKIAFGYENRLCIQYASYIHHGEPDADKLLTKSWAIEAKYEKDLASADTRSEPRMRIRISFEADDKKALKTHLREIQDILGNPRYGKDVQAVIDLYHKSYPELYYKPEKLEEGTWGHNMRWEFYKCDYLPPRNLCAAVFCLAVSKGKVVLTKNKRGWELLGGHLETGESIEDALVREAREEGGFTPRRYKLFGYRKITYEHPVTNKAGGYYPFPVSYIPHFVAISDLPLLEPCGDETIESASFTTDDAERLSIPLRNVIAAGVEAYNTLGHS